MARRRDGDWIEVVETEVQFSDVWVREMGDDFLFLRRCGLPAIYTLPLPNKGEFPCRTPEPLALALRGTPDPRAPAACTLLDDARLEAIARKREWLLVHAW